MNRKSVFEVSISIHGPNLDPDKLTEMIRLKPSKTAIKGDFYEVGPKNRRIRRIEKEGKWVLASKLKSLDLNVHANRLFASVMRNLDRRQKNQLGKFEVYLNCVYFFYGREDYREVTLCLDRKVIEHMAEIGCRLNISPYLLFD